MFNYAPDLIERFPETIGGVILANGMKNSPSSEKLTTLYIDEQEKVKTRIGDTPLSEITSLSAWRNCFRGFGVSPTKYRSAAEALLRRLTKKGDIPSINTLVDIGNLVSIRYGIPVAVFDTESLTGKLSVHFAKGDERFTEIGSDEIKNPEEGEVVFSDETGLVFARRWCWKQSSQSAAKESTTSAIICMEAQHEGSLTDIENAISDLLTFLNEYAGGSYQSTVLSKDRLSFS